MFPIVLASESYFEIVVELELASRAAHLSVAHRPGTTPSQTARLTAAGT